jgi:hypothetical protein
MTSSAQLLRPMSVYRRSDCTKELEQRQRQELIGDYLCKRTETIVAQHDDAYVSEGRDTCMALLQY